MTIESIINQFKALKIYLNDYLHKKKEDSLKDDYCRFKSINREDLRRHCKECKGYDMNCSIYLPESMFKERKSRQESWKEQKRKNLGLVLLTPTIWKWSKQ